MFTMNATYHKVTNLFLYENDDAIIYDLKKGNPNG